MPTNGKIINTKKKLHQAIYELVLEKDISLISVTELCQKAHVTRSTFYRHYAIPHDVMDEYVTESFTSIINDVLIIKYDDLYKDGMEKMRRLCHAYYDNQHIATLFNGYSKKNLNVLRDLLLKKHAMTTIDSNIIFITGGVSSVLNDWISNGFKQSADDIASILTSQITSVVNRK